MKTKSIKSINDVRSFFNSLIKLTGFYILSDCVESMVDDGYLDSKSEHERILRVYQKCVKYCIDNNLDIHKISCDVASDFMQIVEHYESSYILSNSGSNNVISHYLKLEALKLKKDNLLGLTEQLLLKSPKEKGESIVSDYVNKLDSYDKSIEGLSVVS